MVHVIRQNVGSSATDAAPLIPEHTRQGIGDQGACRKKLHTRVHELALRGGRRCTCPRIRPRPGGPANAPNIFNFQSPLYRALRGAVHLVALPTSGMKVSLLLVARSTLSLSRSRMVVGKLVRALLETSKYSSSVHCSPRRSRPSQWPRQPLTAPSSNPNSFCEC